MSLLVPVGDFDHLPRQLGCSLHRGPGRLTLAPERDGCSLEFELELGEEHARLTRLSLTDDLDGRFLRDVVVTLMVAYHGDLEASLDWTPPLPLPQPRLVIRGGETKHPFLAQHEHAGGEWAEAAEVSLDELEEYLAIAHRAWREYRALRGQNEPDHQ